MGDFTSLRIKQLEKELKEKQAAWRELNLSVSLCDALDNGYIPPAVREAEALACKEVREARQRLISLKYPGLPGSVKRSA